MFPSKLRSALCALCKAGLLLSVAPLPACIDRKMVIRSEPPGATVVVDDVPVPAPTPCETPFSHYGTRRVVLEKPGLRRVVADAELSPPWYQYPLLDVFTEVLWPWTIEDRQEFDYAMDPAPPLPTKAEVLERAAELRERMQRLNDADRARDGTPTDTEEK